MRIPFREGHEGEEKNSILGVTGDKRPNAPHIFVGRCGCPSRSERYSESIRTECPRRMSGSWLPSMIRIIRLAIRRLAESENLLPFPSP